MMSQLTKMIRLHIRQFRSDATETCLSPEHLNHFQVELLEIHKRSVYQDTRILGTSYYSTIILAQLTGDHSRQLRENSRIRVT